MCVNCLVGGELMIFYALVSFRKLSFEDRVYDFGSFVILTRISCVPLVAIVLID